MHHTPWYENQVIQSGARPDVPGIKKNKVANGSLATATGLRSYQRFVLHVSKLSINLINSSSHQRSKSHGNMFPTMFFRTQIQERQYVMLGNKRGFTIMMLGVRKVVVTYLYLMFQVFHPIKSKCSYIIYIQYICLLLC